MVLLSFYACYRNRNRVAIQYSVCHWKWTGLWKVHLLFLITRCCSYSPSHYCFKLQFSESNFDGTQQYARNKRVQVCEPWSLVFFLTKSTREREFNMISELPSGCTHWMVGWEIQQQGGRFLLNASRMGWYSWSRQEFARTFREVSFLFSQLPLLVHLCFVIWTRWLLVYLLV